MAISLGIVLCIAYIVGLLCTGMPIGTVQLGDVSLPLAGPGVASLVILFALTAPKRWKLGLSVSHWVGVAGVGLLAACYISLRSPAPEPQDISLYVERAQAIAPVHIVSGQVIDEPRLNRGLKARFRLAVNQLEIADTEGSITFQIPTRGRLYVTAPLPQVTGLHAGQQVTAKGRLYLPQSALNPNGFDFQAYLTQQQTFAGFVAEALRFPKTQSWGVWQIQQRIVRTQIQALGSPLGQLVSAMALGQRAVDLPFDIQDLFARVGLAHTIAASGFHVSLLLGTVLALVRSRPQSVQVAIGLTTLAGYVTLTGLQASVVRAAIMGGCLLAGIALERKVKPLGALLAAVTLMLLANPNWIWNIGFQLSVAATFGLIVMASAIAQRLDWLPATIASWVAVPIAATLWTLPLMLYHFNVISGLSIALNVLATPLVFVVSLGGISSSAIAVLSPAIGKLLASLLHYPAQGLLWLARTSSQWPGSAIAIGQISVWQLMGLYAILFVGVMEIRQALVKRFLPVIFLGILLFPMGWRMLVQSQITVLAAAGELIWVMQDHGHTTLVNSGTEKTAFYTVQPFLEQAGINQIDRAIAPAMTEDDLAGWQTLLQRTPSLTLHGPAVTAPLPELSGNYRQLPVGQSRVLEDLTVQLLGAENPILRLTTPQQTWLLLPALSLPLQDYLAKAGSVLQSQVLVWNGDELSESLLAAVQPQVAICYGRTLPQFVERRLQKAHIQTYWTTRDGAITWQNARGFQGYRETKHRNTLY